MTNRQRSSPVRPQGRTLSSRGATAGKRGRRPFRRLFPTTFVILGLVTGVVISTIFGIYVVYAEMMSRVTYTGSDIRYDSFYDIPDLMADYDPDQLGLDLPHEPGGEDFPVQTDDIQVRDMEGIENILLLGVDTSNYSGRSDVIMIISINHHTRKISIVSLMRAMYVNIGARGHSRGLLNAAYAYGGAGLAIQTVEKNFGIPIKGFVAVNFRSFVNIVDAIGGVTINLTGAEGRVLGLPGGLNRLSGRQALDYSRIRKIDDDFHRNQRQRNVINSVLNEMASGGGASLYKAATVILANTYTNLDLDGYITKAPTYLAYERQQLQLPDMSETRMYYVNGQEVWWFDMTKTHDRLTRFLTQ